MPELYEKSAGGDDQERDIQEGKFFAAVGYFFFLCFVPLFLKRDSRFATFHGKQALILFILETAAGILSVVPLIGPLVSGLAFIVFGLVSLFAIYQVLIGQEWQIPYVYDISMKVKI